MQVSVVERCRIGEREISGGLEREREDPLEAEGRGDGRDGQSEGEPAQASAPGRGHGVSGGPFRYRKRKSRESRRKGAPPPVRETRGTGTIPFVRVRRSGRAGALACVAVLLGLSGTILAEVPQADAVDGGGRAAPGLIGAKAALHGTEGLVSFRAERIYLARVDREDGERLRQEEAIAPSFEREGYVFFAGVEPGRYAPIAAVVYDQAPKPGPPAAWVAYLSEAAIREARVDVGPGEAAYVGDLEIELGEFSGEVDLAQRRSARLLEPDLRGEAETTRFGGALRARDVGPDALMGFIDVARSSRAAGEFGAALDRLEAGLPGLRPAP